MKNKILKFIAFLTLCVSVFVAFAWPFFEMMVHCKGKSSPAKKKRFSLSHMKINHPRYKFAREYETGKAWCQCQAMEDISMVGRDGLRLHARYLPAEDAKRSVILCHGYKGSGFGDFAYTARFLHENHCNLLFIDERCCGESEGEYITFGAKEQYDVQGWAYSLDARNTQGLPIYLYGESMGAAAVLMASGHELPDNVKGLVADCGFGSMKGQLRDMAANWFHIHWIELLLVRVDLFCRLFAGFSMKEADTAKAMETNRRPVLFFHGQEDTYVRPEHSLKNYRLCRAPKELVMVPDARHLCSAYEAPALYRKKLLDFFQKYDQIQEEHTS